MLFSQNLVLNC